MEREHRAFDEQRRRDEIRQSTRYFTVDGIQIKLALFNTTEKEDLTLFAEDFPSVFETEDEEEDDNGGGKEAADPSVEVNESLFAGDDDDDEDLDDLDEEGSI